MPVYMIGYDLRRSEEDKYIDLYTALEAIGRGGYWDCLDSTWLAVTDKTPAEIRDALKPYLKEDDRLLVMRYGGEPHGVGSRTIARLGSRITFSVRNALSRSPQGLPTVGLPPLHGTSLRFMVPSLANETGTRRKAAFSHDSPRIELSGIRRMELVLTSRGPLM